MATVPCPQCKRALNLPDGRDFEAACCPLCRHTFTPPATPRVVAAPLPAPTEQIPPRFPALPQRAPAPDDDDVPLRSPLAGREDDDYQSRSQRSKGRQALESAGVWLRIMAWVGLCTTLPCCATNALVMSEMDFARSSRALPAVLCLLSIAYLFILSTVGSLQQQKSHDLATCTVAVGLMTTSGLILLNLPLFLKVVGVWHGPLPVLDDTCCGGLLIVPTWVVILCGLIGSIKGLFVLLRPDARELFRGPASEPGE